MEKNEIRVRFAPSPTGPLHIGGVRTALYNYLFAKQKGGTFILRIEDTDRTRFVEGAEKYIIEALNWLGIEADESPFKSGKFGPYRQSDRKDIYQTYAKKLINNGTAYYAFDTPEDLEKMREEAKEKGIHSQKYDASIRLQMKNSLSLPDEEVKALLENGTPYVIRLKINTDEQISFHDEIRGKVSFDSNELDDKVLMKTDGMPTYHMANIIDDHLMEISHVIRGEEWLSSTAHHVLLYRAFGWEQSMPKFAHLPLILKPSGKGKLSKRDGQKLGIPVFPKNWEAEGELFSGFKETGFLPEAVINFLAFLGWNPGTEKELYSMEELIADFDLEKVSKSGAKFDYPKALWFNQKYIQDSSVEAILEEIRPQFKALHIPEEKLSAIVSLYQNRVQNLNEFGEQAKSIVEAPTEFDQKAIKKKWKGEGLEQWGELINSLERLDDFSSASIEQAVKAFMNKHELGFGKVLPLLRIALAGNMKGPDIFPFMELVGKEAVLKRLREAPQKIEAYKTGPEK